MRDALRHVFVTVLALSLAAAAPAAWANRGPFLTDDDGDGDEEEVTAAPAADLAAGYAAIDAGEYETAIAVFEAAAAADPANAEVYNQLGYINRRLQNFDVAFAYYGKALSIDPNYAPAHHYIGEAYLEIGDLAHAEEHLAKLDLICLFGCDDFDELKQAVELYRSNHKG